ncbi:MAG: type II/IV secretion system protein [Bacilli bacterium]|nr:type II/IV secretion system protein [Bacilli bacterium]
MLKTFDFQKIPVVDIVNEILVDSSKRGASDIHFDPYEEYLLVRIRIDGDLFDYTQVPNSARDYMVTRIKTISKMNITETRRPQDGAIKATLQGIDLDLRVSSLPVSNGEKIVIRILDYSMSLAGIDELGFSEENYKKLLELVSIPNGIILVTGATGTGKSTTVYSILQHLNRSTTNIITVEDPIEMDIKGVNQVQVNSQIDLTFASALRSILRQDPNIIMIGEIRDTETAKIAVRASITGHLVLSTVHTNNSLNTIERLIDMDVPKYLLASALEGIISQKLARKLCPHCRTLRNTTDYEKQIFSVVTGKVPEAIYDVEGCEHCHNGYSGRIAIQEVLIINQNIRDALSNNVPKETLRDMVYSADVTTLLEDGLNKVIAGETTFSEIINLIELDDDNKLSENYNLKQAINLTKEAHIAKEKALTQQQFIGNRESHEKENQMVENLNIQNS